jgi:hypothetical protein
MTPLERAERALAENLSTFLTDIDGSNEDVVLRNAVRAVLTAIREPSEGMEDHGQGAILERWVKAEGPDVDSAKASWQAMIDAALAEG